MAHVAKHTRSAAGHLCAHYDRSETKISNENIDPERTGENYNLAPVRDISQVEFIRQRTVEVQCMNRKDVNVMCSWIVTAPKDLPLEDNQRFFKGVYSFLAARYGGDKNIISSYVHMDEITPHMHFAFVPVVTDRRKGTEKVSAKECVNKKDLQTFHLDLERHMGQIFGREVGILNEATKNGNRTVANLKRDKAAQDVLDASKMASEALGRVQVLERREKALQGKIEGLENKLGGMVISAEKIERIPVKLTKLSQLPGAHESRKEIIVTKSDWDSVKKTAVQYPDPKLKEKIKRLESEKKALQQENAGLKEQAPSLTERLRVAGLESENRELKRYIGQIPKEIRQRIEQDKKLNRGNDIDWER
jgi:hypothetical protein